MRTEVWATLSFLSSRRLLLFRSCHVSTFLAPALVRHPPLWPPTSLGGELSSSSAVALPPVSAAGRGVARPLDLRPQSSPPSFLHTSLTWMTVALPVADVFTEADVSERHSPGAAGRADSPETMPSHRLLGLQDGRWETLGG